MRTIWFAALLLLLSRPSFADHYLRGVRVSAPPPAYRVETPPRAPSSRYQWIAGYWASRGGKQVWIAGRWALPPAPSYVWEPARWVTEDGGQFFYDGHWRAADEPDPGQAYQPPPPPLQEVVVEAPPPAPPEEVRPPTPFAGATWISGYWQWSGDRHFWVAGRWSAQPPGFGWQRHHWDHRGDGRWVQRPGHWEHHDEGEHRDHHDEDHGDR